MAKTATSKAMKKTMKKAMNKAMEEAMKKAKKSTMKAKRVSKIARGKRAKSRLLMLASLLKGFCFSCWLLMLASLSLRKDTIFGVESYLIVIGVRGRGCEASLVMKKETIFTPP